MSTLAEVKAKEGLVKVQDHSEQTENSRTKSPARSSSSGEATAHSSPATSLASTVVSDYSSEPSTLFDSVHKVNAVRQHTPSVQIKAIPCPKWTHGLCFLGDSCVYLHDPEVTYHLNINSLNHEPDVLAGPGSGTSSERAGGQRRGRNDR